MEVYLDNAATTRVLPEIATAMADVMVHQYGNPSGIYKKSREAAGLVLEARERVARLLHTSFKDIYFTSGGSEGDTMLLRGAARALRHKGKHIVTTQIEHHAVLRTCAALEREGFEVAYVPVGPDGRVDPAAVRKALRRDTILLSVMYANNEIGTLQPVAELGALARERGILFHTDAVQAAGHVPIDVEAAHIDLLTLTAHKFHGPKGCGAVYVRHGIEIEPLIYGGPQERGWRAGTENVPGICGLGMASDHAVRHMEETGPRIAALRDHLIDRILTEIPGTTLNGSWEFRLPNNANFCIDGVSGEELLLLLDFADIAASSGSACASGSLDPSHVLLALGLAPEQAKSSLRLTLSEFTTQEEIDYTVEKLKESVERLRNASLSRS
jgi:cysteine desulfurase